PVPPWSMRLSFHRSRTAAVPSPGAVPRRCAIFRAVRIASLLPSATEIVCALGCRTDLVGRSHECDFPPGVEELPILTSARIGPLPSSRAIDRAVRDVLKEALAIYQIDLERLRAARPEVIVTQDLCEVCAV